MAFQPDYRQMLDVLNNRQPTRLPLYEHIISPVIMEKILDTQFADLVSGEDADLREFFSHYCRFFKEMTYDTVSFEVCIVSILPDSGAILGGRPGPIQNRDDFEKYPWDELAQRYWNLAAKQFEMLAECLPDGMKAVGGVGNGVFEISEDLVGFEYLAYMMVDDPELFRDLYRRIGDLMVDIWIVFLERYADHFAVCRFGDDLGFKTSTFLAPDDLRRLVIPWHKRFAAIAHEHGKLFFFHSCGQMYDLIDDYIDVVGIDAKHSFEDAVLPVTEAKKRYGDRLTLLGGIDVDLLARADEAVIRARTREVLEICLPSGGYFLGSGNWVSDYIPIDHYLWMLDEARRFCA